ncbi:Scr1 family TA system antitoxin-like transcriptional regulator [Kitasatospora sp. NPDC090091]|uniref:Scr1 family TA system antitoxin-like transcriptional regulator n=1 Tax=Kitasatospora sp. NPDC090091 TaxID=3364081 RepID=UPI00380C6244
MTAATHVGNLVLGTHLRHLRECQDLTPASVAARLPDPAPGVDTINLMEAGSSPALRDAAANNRLAAFLHAYGAGLVAVADFHQAVDGIDRHNSRFPDDGAGWTHRYQLLEQRADALLLAGVTSIPAPLRTIGMERAVWLELHAPSVPLGLPALMAQPTGGCQPCRLYRDDLLKDSAMAGVWRAAVAAARAEAFDKRIRRESGQETVVLLDENLLYRPQAGPRAHADQMRHLVDLGATTRLRVRVVPANSGAILLADMAELTTQGRTLTAELGDSKADYADGVHSGLRFALERSLDPEASARLLERAAAGTLPRRWP